MRKTTILLILLTLLNPLIIFGQNHGTIKGRVTDKDGDGLIGAFVFVEASSRGIYVEDDGYFIIEELEPGAHKLIVKAENYSDDEELVTVKAGETSEIKIEMERKSTGFLDFLFYNVLCWLIKQL